MKNWHFSNRMRVLLVLLIFSLLVSAFTLAITDLARPRQVFSSGGSQASADKISLRATLGEAIVGGVRSEKVSLGQGFWHSSQVAAQGKEIFLPLLSK